MTLFVIFFFLLYYKFCCLLKKEKNKIKFKHHMNTIKKDMIQIRANHGAINKNSGSDLIIA